MRQLFVYKFSLVFGLFDFTSTTDSVALVDLFSSILQTWFTYEAFRRSIFRFLTFSRSSDDQY